MGNKVFTFGNIRIREVKGKYYVYIIEKDKESNRRDVDDLSNLFFLDIALDSTGLMLYYNQIENLYPLLIYN